MAGILIVCGSTEGQTWRIARFILSEIHLAGFGADMAAADDLYRIPLGGKYDAVIVGASVHNGKHQSSVINFVSDNLALLSQLPTAFFSVSLSAAIADAEHQAEAQQYVEYFCETTGWRPNRIQLVAGALRNTEMDYFQRELARYIVHRTLGQADAAIDYDFTDYDDVRQFVRDFLEQEVQVRLQPAPNDHA